jgi:hypothetical protein
VLFLRWTKTLQCYNLPSLFHSRLSSVPSSSFYSSSALLSVRSSDPLLS